jgi:hypothetical protein
MSSSPASVLMVTLELGRVNGSACGCNPNLSPTVHLVGDCLICRRPRDQIDDIAQAVEHCEDHEPSTNAIQMRNFLVCMSNANAAFGCTMPALLKNGVDLPKLTVSRLGGNESAPSFQTTPISGASTRLFSQTQTRGSFASFGISPRHVLSTRIVGDRTPSWELLALLYPYRTYPRTHVLFQSLDLAGVSWWKTGFYGSIHDFSSVNCSCRELASRVRKIEFPGCAPPINRISRTAKATHFCLL